MTNPVPSIPLVPSEEEVLLRKTVRDITASFGPDYITEVSKAGRNATELWDALAAQGFLGVSLPEEHGGGGMGMTGLAAVVEEMSIAGGALPLLAVSPAIAGTMIALHGTEEQKQRYLPGLADGSAKMAFAVTEPDAGSNTHNLSTSATPDGDDFLVRGQKTFISGMEEATNVLLVARLRGEGGQLGLPVLLVLDPDAEGLSRQPVPTDVNWPDQQWTLYLDDVRVSRDRLIGGVDGGMRALFDGLNPERIVAAAGSIGIARHAIDRAVDYAKGREVWGQPIGAHQAVAHPLAELEIRYQQARLMLQKACVLTDLNDPGAGEAANIAKLACCDVAVDAVDRAIQTHGGNGVTEEYGLMRLWRAARVAQVIPVSREMIVNFVASRVLGLPKSY